MTEILFFNLSIIFSIKLLLNKLFGFSIHKKKNYDSCWIDDELYKFMGDYIMAVLIIIIDTVPN